MPFKAADTLPTWLKFITLLALAFLLLLGVAIYQLPAILHEAPPAIRALREKPVQQPLPTDVDQHDQVAGVK